MIYYRFIILLITTYRHIMGRQSRNIGIHTKMCVNWKDATWDTTTGPSYRFTFVIKMQEETEQPDTLSLLSKLLLCCCKRKCWVVTESLDKNVYPVPFRWYQFLFGVLGIIVYVFDVGSDIILAFQYQEIEMWTAFILSTTFIVFPFLVSNTIIVYFDFYFDNNQRIALRRRDCESMSRVCCIPTMCTCPMMLGQIVRYCKK